MKQVPIYQGFASIYDALMDEAPYEQWLAYFERCIQQYSIKNKRIVDLGCGTGRLAAMVAKKGYELWGVDVSEEMLAMANERFHEEGIASFTLIHQDMRELQLPGLFGLMYSFCDCLNYITEEEELLQVFLHVHQHLEEGGLFLFDMHSPYKITHIYGSGPVVDDDPEISYMWIPVVDEAHLLVEHNIHFFVREQADVYRRFTEVHVQRSYPLEKIRALLYKANFDILSITADFADEGPHEQSERYFFAAMARK